MNKVNDWILSIINDAEANYRLGLFLQGSYLLEAVRYLKIHFSENQILDFKSISDSIKKTEFHKNFVEENGEEFYF